jgi:hypothetical protein
MTVEQLSIHDNIMEAIYHLEKAHNLIRVRAEYSCQSVDINAVESASSILTNLCDVLKDVHRSTLEHSANGFVSLPKGR